MSTTSPGATAPATTADGHGVDLLANIGTASDAERAAEIAKLERQMKEAAHMLEFEYAAILRDRIMELRGGK